MARILITTWGSLGDLHPFLALGLGLRSRGHSVRFAVESILRPPLDAEGFAVHPLTDVAASALDEVSPRLFRGASVPESLRLIYRHVYFPTLSAKIADLRAALADADLLVTSVTHPAARIAAESTGVPWASVTLSPALPSATLAPLAALRAVPRVWQPTVNKLAWWAGLAVVRSIVDGPVNDARSELGLARGRDWLTLGALSPRRAFVAASPAFVPPRRDWPGQVRMTGFLFWDGARDWHAPPELSAFLAAPGPVVAVSTGSMAPAVREAFSSFFRATLQAVRQAGARALVIGAAPGVLPEPLPDGVLAVDYAPFSLVYPRCAAVVHHGGIGTLAQGLRAGVPALVVPWGADQDFNADHLASSGAGLTLSRRAYTEQRAARAIGRLLGEPRYRERAREIAAHLAHEDGVAKLCHELGSLLAQDDSR